MDVASVSSSFRFRDHQGTEDATDSDTSSEISSVSVINDDELELESMTGKGINRLCAELVEVKAISDEDFHRNIFTNYSAFVGVYDDVKELEQEIHQLRTHMLMQKKMVNDLIDGVCVKVLSDEAIESVLEVAESAEIASPIELEDHINHVSDKLDVFLSENRIDEAILILEIEQENLQTLVGRLGENDINTLLDVLMLYNSAISERKAMLMLQLTLVAENSRISAPELQKALVGLCKLGESHLATQLLIKYYHSRIASGIRSLQSSKSSSHGVYIKELSKFVFSVVSQAAKSFIMLYGETSPYASELLQWISEEIEVFSVAFTKYVKSISEISGGLSAAAESVQIAMSYCSLLETQNLLLCPLLIEHIRACMEEVLQVHINHYKKVINIFTATDSWVLGRYLVSGIVNERYSSMVVGQQPQYCLLSNSGRKFVTLLQAITKDVTPFLALQMEGFIVKGLVNVFTGYLTILERAISSETNAAEKSSSGIILADSESQKVSLLANVSTLEYLFTSVVTSITGELNCVGSKLMKDQSVGFQAQDFDTCMMAIQEASGRLRDIFCQQFIYRVVSLETTSKLTHEACIDSDDDPNLVHHMIPSVSFQVLFLELRELEKLGEHHDFEVDWLMDLLRELIEAIFISIANNKENWETQEEHLTLQHLDNLNQFVLDVHLLVEITKYGGYFSKSPLVLITLMESAFISAGLDPERCVNDDKWALKAATEAIRRLLEIEETESPSNVEIVENGPEHAGETFEDECKRDVDVLFKSDSVAVDAGASEDGINSGKVTMSTEPNHLGHLSNAPKGKGSADTNATSLTDFPEDAEDIGSENAAYYDRFHFIQDSRLPQLLLSAGIGQASGKGFRVEQEARSEHGEAENFIAEPDDKAEAEIASAYEILLSQGPVKQEN